MNIQQLKYFVEVSKCKSFSKAAKSLYISQQGISMAIMRLESEFSAKLFIRTSKGLMLTADGEYLLGCAETILAEFEKCEDYFHKKPPIEAMLNIAGVQGVISEFLSDYIVDFQDNHQQYKLFLREYTDRACDTIVENGEAELGVGLEPMDTKKFDVVKLFSKRLVLLVHTSHPLAGLKSIPTELLHGLPIAMVDEKAKSADLFLDICKKQGVVPKVYCRVGEVVAVHRLVSRNKCAGLSVETVAAELNTPDTVAIPFEDPSLLWMVVLFKKKDTELSAGAHAFSDYVCKRISEDSSLN